MSASLLTHSVTYNPRWRNTYHAPNNRSVKQSLVGVFWTRLGTPTGEAASGTVEEIAEHLRAKKPAMIYFSSRPVAPESIDQEQYAAVRAFKEDCRKRGLVEEFDDPVEFRAKFAKQLQVTLNQNPYLKELVSTSEIQIDTAPSPVASDQVSLSEEATDLLLAAASEDGTILKLAFLGGRHIQAGKQQFGSDRGRESAKWEAALDELLANEFVVGRGYKGEVFELTHRGWELADALSNPMGTR